MLVGFGWEKAAHFKNSRKICIKSDHGQIKCPTKHNVDLIRFYFDYNFLRERNFEWKKRFKLSWKLFGIWLCYRLCSRQRKKCELVRITDFFAFSTESTWTRPGAEASHQRRKPLKIALFLLVFAGKFSSLIWNGKSTWHWATNRWNETSERCAVGKSKTEGTKLSSFQLIEL